MKPAAEDWPELLRLLDEALALNADGQAKLIASLPTRLQVPLRSLLDSRAAVAEGGFLERAAAWPIGAADTLHSGQRIGPWSLIKAIGQGGMAWVWLAKRADGEGRRQVALKLPRGGWASGLGDRLRRERDILGALEHPHIARLYDAGTDDHGRPWLALEWVDGIPISEWVQSRAPDTATVLRLLLQACDALAYAHAKLVVHRDIKPSNLLVTADGKVRLLDFGIAKLLDDGFSTATELTRASGHAYTPGYASPEQLRGEALGTASDVFSLGVLAFELLAGQGPFRLRRGSAAELEEAILSGDRLRASDLAPTAERRHALRGDLDAVLAHALEPEVSARYISVEAFAADLRSWLEGAAVRVRRPGAAERAWRWWRSHRVLATSATTVLLALLAGGGLAAWQAHEARVERDRAVAAAERARQVQAFLVDIFSTSSARQSDPRKAQATTARELLAIGQQRFGAGSLGQPELRMELSALLGRLHGELGLTEHSVPLTREAVEHAQATHGRASPAHLEAAANWLEEVRSARGDQLLEPAVAEAQALLAASVQARTSAELAARAELLIRLSEVQVSRQLTQAQALAEEAAAAARQAGDPMREGRALLASATALGYSGRNEAAIEQAEAGIALLEAHDPQAVFNLVPARVTLAEQQAELLRLDAARASIARALSHSVSRLGANHRDAVQSRYRLGSVLSLAGALDEALPHLDAVAQVLRGQGEEQALLLSSVLTDLGNTLRESGRIHEARAALGEALRLRDRLRPNSPMSAALRENLALALSDPPAQDLRGASSMLDAAATIRQAAGTTIGSSAWDRLLTRRLWVARARNDSASAAMAMQQIRGGQLADAAPRRSWLVVAQLRALHALDRQDLQSAGELLQATGMQLESRRGSGEWPSLRLAQHVLCTRWSRQSGLPADAARHAAKARVWAQAGYGPQSPWMRELRAAEREPLGPVAPRAVGGGPCPDAT